MSDQLTELLAQQHSLCDEVASSRDRIDASRSSRANALVTMRGRFAMAAAATRREIDRVTADHDREREQLARSVEVEVEAILVAARGAVDPAVAGVDEAGTT